MGNWFEVPRYGGSCTPAKNERTAINPISPEYRKSRSNDPA
jgi:hypothetical protein